eukprot:scaffold1401_cov330-Pavlova_lutheri.AAC.144
MSLHQRSVHGDRCGGRTTSLRSEPSAEKRRSHERSKKMATTGMAESTVRESADRATCEKEGKGAVARRVACKTPGGARPGGSQSD